jgi:hypothetical protein
MPPSDENQRYQSIFESASDGLIVTEFETQLVVEANPAACAAWIALAMASAASGYRL